MQKGMKSSITDGSADGSDDHHLLLGQQENISRTKRHLPPAHYSLKFERYSLLSKTEKYESGVFEAGGYKWKLIFYPNGDKNNAGENYISLYLVIAETDSFPFGWEVNVNFKLLVYDQVEDLYLAIQDANARGKRFHEMKKMWGFAQLLALETFKDPSNGYLVHDTCVFGAEVLVIKHNSNWESFSFVSAPDISNATFTWKIENFTCLNQAYYDSEIFTIGGRDWKLRMYPANDQPGKQQISLFLMLSDWGRNPIYANYKLRLLAQSNGKDSHERTVSSWFGESQLEHGCKKFISKEDLRRMIVSDSVIVEVEFLVVSKTKFFSKVSEATAEKGTNHNQLDEDENEPDK